MIMPGVDCPPEERPTPEEAARRTLEVLRRRVPPAVPGIVFLSGIYVLMIFGRYCFACCVHLSVHFSPPSNSHSFSPSSPFPSLLLIRNSAQIPLPSLPPSLPPTFLPHQAGKPKNKPP